MMPFYIAEKREDGKFTLWWKEDGVCEFHTPEDALNSFKTAVQLHGTLNVKLLQEVHLSITTEVKLFDPKEFFRTQ